MLAANNVQLEQCHEATLRNKNARCACVDNAVCVLSCSCAPVPVQKKGGDECVFQCGRWLDPETPTLSLSRWQDTVKYTITAHTSADPTAAATAAPAPAFEGRAYVVLTGGWGCTSETELVNDATKWAAGEAQQFEVEATDVGALQSVALRVAPGASGQACR